MVTTAEPTTAGMNMTPAQAMSALVTQYPQFAYMAQIPELLKMAQTLIAEGPVSANTVQAALFQTNWWKSLPAPSRNWAQLVAQDPAEARRQLAAEQADIMDYADKVGAPITTAQATSLATAYFSGGQTPQQLASAIGQSATYANYQAQQAAQKSPYTGLANAQQEQAAIASGQQLYHQDPNTGTYTPVANNYNSTGTGSSTLYTQNGPQMSGGAISSTMDAMQKLASEYMVPVSQQSLFDWAKQAVVGSTLNGATTPTSSNPTSITPTSLGTGLSSAMNTAGGVVDPTTGANLGSTGLKDFQNYVQAQAKSLFPQLTSAIDQGITVQQYADPYKQIAAKVLQIAPDSVDFSNPKWNAALNQINPQTGARQSMSLSDWQNKLQSDPSYGWQYTDNAKKAGSAMALNLVKAMGGI